MQEYIVKHHKANILIFLLVAAYASSTANACTILTVCRGDVVLFGNNEDYTNPETHYWVIPSGSLRHIRSETTTTMARPTSKMFPAVVIGKTFINGFMEFMEA